MAKKKKNNLPKNPVGRPRKKVAETTPKKVNEKYSKKKPSKKSSKKKLTAKKANDLVKKGSGFASNNFNRIRSLIWKEYGLDYKSYYDADFLKIIKAVYLECKSRDSECSEKEILLIYDEIQENPQREFPKINEELYGENGQIPYYDLAYEEFTEYPSYLWIVSPMILPPPSEFVVASYYDGEGNMDKGYRKYFKEFIDWCNYATKEAVGSSNIDSSDIEIFVKFTKPEYNQALQRWQTEIYICNSQGDRFSFGFEPKGRMHDHTVQLEYIEPVLLTPEQLEVRKVATKKLDSALGDLLSKYENIEKEKSEPKSKKSVKKAAPKKAKNKETKVVKLTPKIDKDKELKTLTKIKKELTSAIKLYREIGDTKRMNKSLKELDGIMAKIKKLSK